MSLLRRSLIIYIQILNSMYKKTKKKHLNSTHEKITRKGKKMKGKIKIKCGETRVYSRVRLRWIL